MAILQLKSRISSAVATNTPYWGLLTNSTNAVKIYDMSIQIGVATLSELGLGLAAAAGTQSGGVPPLNTVLGGTAGSCTIATAWSASPTVPTNYVKGGALGGTIGNMIYWNWVDGLEVPVSSELVLWNVGSGSASSIMSIDVTLEEL